MSTSTTPAADLRRSTLGAFVDLLATDPVSPSMAALITALMTGTAPPAAPPVVSMTCLRLVAWLTGWPRALDRDLVGDTPELPPDIAHTDANTIQVLEVAEQLIDPVQRACMVRAVLRFHDRLLAGWEASLRTGERPSRKALRALARYLDRTPKHRREATLPHVLVLADQTDETTERGPPAAITPTVELVDALCCASTAPPAGALR